MDTQEATIFTAIVIASIILGIIIVFFVLSIIQQQKRNYKLQKAKMLAEIAAMEKERGRIAHDLHDSVGPLLSVIKFSIDGVECIKREDEVQIKSATRQIDELTEQMRNIAINLMPAALLRKGVVTAAAEFLAKIESGTGMHIKFTHSLVSPVDKDQGIHIFRLLQEVTHNAVKHARASELIVRLEEKKDRLCLFLKDNGIGFNYDQKKDSSAGFGLRSVKSRVELMGGSMRVESRKGIGSAFLFEIPKR